MDTTSGTLIPMSDSYGFLHATTGGEEKMGCQSPLHK